MLHSILSKLPKPLDLENLISKTVELFQKHPPSHLPARAWAQVSSNSVLKTTQDFHKLSRQTLEDGERFFQNEAAEIRRRDLLMQRQRQLRLLATRYRRPASWFSGAILVAAMAFYFRGSTLSPLIAGSLFGFQQRLAEIWQRFVY
jgi:TBC1 domain family member 20